MTQEGIVLASRSDWSVLRPLLFESIGQTLEMVLITLVVGGFLGLILGVVLYGRAIYSKTRYSTASWM